MQGNIDFTGSLSGSIAGSGGGGSTVTITPTLESGTKIADYSIDSTSGSLYAPTQEELPDTIVTKALRKYNDTSQTKIMTITTYDSENEQEVSQDIYAPSPVQCWYSPGLEQDYQIGQFTYGGVTQNVYIPYFQRPLTAGNNITIDANNVISASSGASGINYSTTEQDTGVKWIDNKNVYQRVFHTTSVTASPFTIGNIANLGTIIEINGFFLRSGTWKLMDGRSETSAYNTYYCLPYVDVSTGNIIILFGGYAANQFDEMNVIIRYTKSD